MQYVFRKAKSNELDEIWLMIEHAIARRKAEGSRQWQDGYPNPQVIREDIEKGVGFVLVQSQELVGYSAVLINDEPAYADIEGTWLTNSDFVVFHRVAIAEKHLGKGLAQKMVESIENYAKANGILSVKADTNFDNAPMLKIFQKMGYTYCGEVYFRGSARKAYEKVLS